uniref:Uncharacterized protein n=1 Tax=Rhizophora mucronata TaxID=61149 RepID=A0A2P2QDM0_RHIMU
MSWPDFATIVDMSSQINIIIRLWIIPFPRIFMGGTNIVNGKHKPVVLVQIEVHGYLELSASKIQHEPQSESGHQFYIFCTIQF